MLLLIVSGMGILAIKKDKESLLPLNKIQGTALSRLINGDSLMLCATVKNNAEQAALAHQLANSAIPAVLAASPFAMSSRRSTAAPNGLTTFSARLTALS
ncbi:hypothetical protein JHU04_000572 [Brenneria sp. 4F2]|nr:hypothetical protein [Brenneria bubanii]